MESLEFFVKGLVVGLVIAAPVGPIGVLCVRRTLAEGRAVGFASGLGAATADAFYGCIAAFGIAAVSSFLVDQSIMLRLVGGAILCLIGLKTYLAEPAGAATASATSSLPGAYGTTFLLTLTNPTTILSFVAIFAGIGLGGAGSGYGTAAVLVLGVFLGSALWWLGLSVGVGFFRRLIGVETMRVINRISGVLIGAFGLTALWFGVFPPG